MKLQNLPKKARLSTSSDRFSVLSKKGLKPVLACMLATFSVSTLAENATSSDSTVVTVGTTITQLSDSPLLVQIQEKINSDSNEIDAMALRMKEMIRARHNADAINVQATATIEELRNRLRNFEKERANALKQSKLLLSAKDDLRKKLDALQEKHNADRELIASLEGAARERDSALLSLIHI